MTIGVDIGGTFTDLAQSVDGKLRIHKLPSTPENPALAMLDGLDAITEGNVEGLRMVAHGSTVATNAILERKGAKTAMITTAGFRDLLYIGRQNRPELYALQPKIPQPLIPNDHCYELPERLDFSGTVLKELDRVSLEAILEEIAAQEFDSIAVCFLYSYVNPRHEQMVRDRILSKGLMEEWQVALSSDVLPEFREYERASTVSLEAYVRPVMGRYIRRLQEELPSGCSLRIMQSDGGVMSARRAREQAINTVLSGPAAGVIGAFYLAKLSGYDQIITLDMGGTSTDIALCPGHPQRSPESMIDGLPLRTRLIDIETIGAGGGSIARLDAGGALRVGPQSAGANPGPIVYGQGGRQITVSDANAILGRLDPDHFLGGKMPLYLEDARQAIHILADQMNCAPAEAAKGVIDVANVNIDRALRRVSIARGHDPREFTLVAFGGAGAMHACEVAERLEIPRVFVPRYPGVLCALGLLVADAQVGYSYPVIRPFDAELMQVLRTKREEFLMKGREDLAREGIAVTDMRFHFMVDARYMGQAYELAIPFNDDPVTTFHETHRNTYGYALENRPVEIVNFRLEGVGEVEKPDIQPESLVDVSSDEALIGVKESPYGGAIQLFEREKLFPGMRLTGEALVFQMDSTVYIPPGWRGRVDEYRNLILEPV